MAEIWHVVCRQKEKHRRSAKWNRKKKEKSGWWGAGPSDAELLTLKAKRVLEQAEVVVYDRLVGESILLMMPEAAEKIDAGKRSGNHTMPPGADE